MSQSDEAWSEVVEQVKKLGSMFAHHYQAQEGQTGAEVVSNDEVKDALLTIGESMKAAFGTVGDAIKDPDVQDEARQTAASFFDALGVTFSELGDDISNLRQVGDSANPESPEEADGPDTSEYQE